MQNRIIVKQHDIKDCGICCLESIIQYYGGHIPLEILRLETKTNKNGTTALNLIKTAQKIGLDAQGVRLKDIQLKQLILPAIAHVITERGINHFVVIYKIAKNKVYIMDPAKGYVKETVDDFKKKWTNVLLIMKPYKKLPLADSKNIWKDIFSNILNENKKVIIKIMILNIIITVFSVILSYYIKILIEYIENVHKNTIYLIMIIFGFISIMKIFINYIKNEISIYLNKNIDCTIIPNFIKHIMYLPSNVIASHTSGEILTRINELKNIKELFTECLIIVLLNITFIISSSYFLYSLNERLFIILCITSLLYILVSILTNNIIIQKTNDNIETETSFNSSLIDNIESIETTKNLNITKYKLDSLYHQYTEYIKAIFQYGISMNTILLLKNLIHEIGLFIITSTGIILIINNQISLLTLITFNTLLSYFIDPIENCLNELPRLNRLKLSVEKIKDFLNVEEQVEEINEFKNGDIILNNISYSYNNYQNILNNISLQIKEKDRVEIRGKSGCGKSTICKILNKTIEDYKGSIKINNINLKDYTIGTIKKNIIYISQREKIYTDTIKNNIVLNTKTNLKELNKVINITKVDEIVNKKGLRLESLLYDEAYNLSGGEKQRIILARSIIKKPKILILDEALSELDNDLEREIIKNICDYLKNTTIIYVSHKETKTFQKVITMGE